MARVSKDLLPEGYSAKSKRGFYAKIDRDGNLRHYGWYHSNGQSGGKWTLHADPDKMQASVEFSKSYQYPEPGEKPEEKDFQQWLDDWADVINERSGVVEMCNFCYQAAFQVQQLVRGNTGACICNLCIEQMQEMFDEQYASEAEGTGDDDDED
jgi:hypothetical protein